MKTIMNFLIDVVLMMSFTILFLIATVWLLLVAPGNPISVPTVMEAFTAVILWVVGLVGAYVGVDCVVSYFTEK